MAKKPRRSFGSIRKTSAGRYQARWKDADGTPQTGPHTFVKKEEAEHFLHRVEADLVDGVYQPGEGDDTFEEYAASWVTRKKAEGRSPRYIEESQRIIEKDLNPVWGSYRLTKIHGKEVDRWYANLKPNAPSMRAGIYVRFSRILNAAVEDNEQRLKHSPCKIKSAGKVDTKRESIALFPDQVIALAREFPARYQFLILLTAWLSMRFSEFTELRRQDISFYDDAEHGVFATVRVARGITRTKGRKHVRLPKSRSVGQVVIPPHLLDELKGHLEKHVGPEPTALLFPSRRGGQLSRGAFRPMFNRAVEASGLLDEVGHIVPHDLRHTGATYAGMAGASLAELMHRVRHRSVDSAMRYQHANLLRDKMLAEKMSAMLAYGAGYPLRPTRTTGTG